MNETRCKNGFAGGLRHAVAVTLIFLFLCGFLFPMVLSGLSAVMFPSQAKGSLVMADGEAVGAANVGQDFTKPYFMKCRPSACNYNTYYEDAEGNQFYNDGSAFAGLSSGSSNYAPSNPALAERVEADIAEFLAANPDVAREELPADLMTASGSGLDPHVSPEGAQVQIPGSGRGLRTEPGGAGADRGGQYDREAVGDLWRGSGQCAWCQFGYCGCHGPGGGSLQMTFLPHGA